MRRAARRRPAPRRGRSGCRRRSRTGRRCTWGSGRIRRAARAGSRPLGATRPVGGPPPPAAAESSTDDLDERALVECRPRRAAAAGGSAPRPRCGCDPGRGRRRSPRDRRRPSGLSQMWNLKSGVSLRSSARMESQISSSCSARAVATLLGAQRRTLLRGRAGRENRAPPPSARRVYNGENEARRGPGRWLRKTREKRRARIRRASTGSAQAHARRSCTLARHLHEAHLPAQEAQARPHARVSRAHAEPAPAARS